MKIRAVLLGSVALAGLTTAGYAADLGVVTSLDVCDELGLSGLTISSDDNCLVISGGVSFEFDWGDYAGDDPGNPFNIPPYDGSVLFYQFARNFGVVTVPYPTGTITSGVDIDAWLKFVATADSDFGPASATIKLVSNNNNGTMSSSTGTIGIAEAWVSIGDTTQLMAGYKSSIANFGDDAPLNYLGLFNSTDVNTGVGFYIKNRTGGAVIQVLSDLGNGLSAAFGLEGLGGGVPGYPVVVGVLSYAGDGMTAHATVTYDPFLEYWNFHSGFTGSWDPVKVVGAIAADSSGWWNALGSVSATFDMFTVAGSAEATSAGEYGVGGSLSASVSDGVTLNLGGRYFHGVYGEDIAQVEAAITAAVTDTLTLTGAVGAYDSTYVDDYYGKLGLAWAPGGGFTASTSLEAHSNGAYKVSFKAAKDVK
jgi:hypothetical protein